MMADGAFAASLDADSEGEEGRYYVWDGRRDRPAAGRDAQAFRLCLRRHRGWQLGGPNVLNRLHEPGLPQLRRGRSCSTAAEQPLGRARAPAQAEPGRQDPGRLERPDDCGARAGSGPVRPPRLAASSREGTFDAVIAGMGDGDALFHSWRGRRRLPMAFLGRLCADEPGGDHALPADREPAISQHARAWVDHCAATVSRSDGRRLLSQHRRPRWTDRAAEECARRARPVGQRHARRSCSHALAPDRRRPAP